MSITTSLNKAVDLSLAYLDVQREDAVLVLTDNFVERPIADAFYTRVKKIGARPSFLIMEWPDGLSTMAGRYAFPKLVGKAMQGADAVVACTKFSPFHGEAAKEARYAYGTRGITIDAKTVKDFIGEYDLVDHRILEKVNMEICEGIGLNRQWDIRVTSALGSNFEVAFDPLSVSSINPGPVEKGCSGPGTWLHWPPGHIAIISPIEGTANGILVFDDLAMYPGGMGRPRTPVQFTVKKGFATGIEGGQEAEQLRQDFQQFIDDAKYAAVVIGTNPYCPASLPPNGALYVQYKRAGYFSGCFGSTQEQHNPSIQNTLFGMTKPTVVVNGKTIVSEGELLVLRRDDIAKQLGVRH